MHNIMAYRLKWYRENFLAFLHRYQQMLLMVVFSLLPMAFSEDFLLGLIKLASSPIFSLFNSDITIHVRLLMLISVQTVYTLWIAMQKKAVTGSPLSEYLMTLPIKKQDCWNINLAVMLRANNIMWLPLIMAITSTILTQDTTLLITYNLINILSVACLIVLAQMLWLYRSTKIYLILLAVNILYVSTTLLEPSKTNTLFTVVVMALLAFTVKFFPQQVSVQLCLTLSTIKPNNRNASAISKRGGLIAIIAIHIKMLLAFFKIQTTYRMLVGILLSSLCIFILRKSGLTLSLEYLLLFMAIEVLIASEFFSLINTEREKTLPFISSLPIQKGFWLLLDSSSVLFLTMLMALPLLMHVNGILHLTTLFTLLVFTSSLVVAQFLARKIFQKQAASASITLCITWSFIGFLFATTGTT